MAVELMAVRLMAPWFGQSQPVWTNVIGVVLLSLAVGQWLGGRWAEQRARFRPASLLAVAGVLSIALPEIVMWLARWSLPSDLALEEAYLFVTAGSLLVALTALGVPVVAMGAIAPWLVRLSREVSSEPGRVAGRVLAAGTIGSLVGTFGVTHLLLETVGAAWAVRGAGALLLALGLVVWRVEGGRMSRAGALLVLPLAALLAPSPAAREQVLESVDTAYQHARVVALGDGTRLLRINEGLDSFHSALVPGSLWTGRYFDAFVAPALLAPRDERGRKRVMIVGLGGGTMARQILSVMPDVEVTGVEIDAELVRLGRRWFELPDAVEVIAGQDGRVALRAAGGQWGAVLLDAYAQQIYLPQHLCTEEFFVEVRQRLLPGGVAAANLGGRTREDPVVAAVAATFARVFDDATMARVPGTRNMLLWGWNGPAPGDDERAEALLEGGVADQLGWIGSRHDFAPVRVQDGPRLVDGDAPVEALAHRSWRGSTWAF
jgi:spermidine synthase